MKVGAIKATAQGFTLDQIEAAIADVTERQHLALPIEGDDLGEKLTHLLLARRLHLRLAAGEEFRDAFRALMAEVRETLTNE